MFFGGSGLTYNQSATYTLAAIVQRVTGETLTDYLQSRLFDPIGAGEVSWQDYPKGRAIGFSGVFATTDTIARLGQFYLQRGAWKGRQLLSPELIANATRPHISTLPRPDAPPEPSKPDWEQGYGFQFWMSRHGYRGDGAYGQFCLVLPEQDAVIAMTAQTDDMQSVLDAVWDKLLPAFGDTPLLVTETDLALADRLTRLTVPGFLAEPAPFADEAEWSDVTFVPAEDAWGSQPSLLSVRVLADRDGWKVTLSEADFDVMASFDGVAWTVTEAEGAVPTACLGGWVAPGILRFDVAFLDTPHRLAISCRLPERTFEASWRSVPLFTDRLSDLRSPSAGGTFRQG